MSYPDPGVTVILGTWANGGETFDADYCKIDLTPEYAKRLMNRITLFKNARDTFEDTAAIDFYQAGLWFFSWFDGLDGVVDAETGVSFAEMQFEDCQTFLTTQHIEIPEEHQVEMAWQGRLIVEESSVCWMAWHDNADVRVYTIDLPHTLIREVAEGIWKPKLPA